MVVAPTTFVNEASPTNLIPVTSASMPVGESIIGVARGVLKSPVGSSVPAVVALATPPASVADAEALFASGSSLPEPVTSIVSVAELMAPDPSFI